MNKQKLIKDCVKRFEEEYNFGKKERKKCTFFSGIKPADYFLPLMILSAKQAKIEIAKLAWFCEIWVDDKCVIRQSMIPNKKYTMKKLEDILLGNIIQESICHSIHSEYINQTQNHDNKNNRHCS